jgi:hypothetical protein
MIATTNTEESRTSKASSSGITRAEGTSTVSFLEVKSAAGAYGIDGHMVELETPLRLT